MAYWLTSFMVTALLYLSNRSTTDGVWGSAFWDSGYYKCEGLRLGTVSFRVLRFWVFGFAGCRALGFGFFVVVGTIPDF